MLSTSRTISCCSITFEESAECKANRRTFLGNLKPYLRGLGAKITPPPLHNGERVLVARAPHCGEAVALSSHLNLVSTASNYLKKFADWLCTRHFLRRLWSNS